MEAFVLLLRKGVYSWERSDETSLPYKKSFYSELYLEALLIKTTHMLKKCLKS